MWGEKLSEFVFKLVICKLMFKANRGRIRLDHWICCSICASLGRGWRGRGGTKTHSDSDGPSCSHSRLPSPETPVPLPLPGATPALLPAPWRSPPLPARPSPALQAEGPAGPMLTFFRRHLGRQESPPEQEPEGELDSAPPGSQLHAERRGGLAPGPCLLSRLRPASLGSCSQRMNLFRSLPTGAHALHNLPAWPTVMMKDQGEWVEKLYCLYLF